MPAAIPAIGLGVSLLGTVAGAIGRNKQANAEKKAAADRKAALQNVVDFNYNADLEHYNQNMGNYQNMFAQAGQPQVTTTSSNEWRNTVDDSTRSMDFGAEGNEAASGVLQAARNAPFEVNALLAEQEAAANRSISGAQRTQRGKIGNLAAQRGVDAQLMSLGMDQPFNAQRLDASLGAKQQAYANRVGAQGNIANVLKGLFQKDVTHSEQNMKGGSKGATTGGPNFMAQFAALDAMKKPKKEAIV
jgi:hypothetical protein